MASYSGPFGRPHKRSALAAVSWKRSRLWGNTLDGASLVSCPNPDIKPHQCVSASYLVARTRHQSTGMCYCVLGSRTCWFGLRSILRGETIIAAPLLLLLNLELIDFALETLTPPCSCYWTSPAKLTRSGRACLKAGSAASTERQARTWACVREEAFFHKETPVFFVAQVYNRLDRNIVKGTMLVGDTGLRNLTTHINTNINMNINTTANQTNCPS